METRTVRMGSTAVAQMTGGGDGEITYYGHDILGSVTARFSDRGQRVDELEYRAFGELRRGELTTEHPYGYTGKAMDPATRIYDYGFRDYAPELARFTAVDPKRDGNNWYAYLGNDPVNFVDRLGLERAAGDGTESSGPAAVMDRLSAVVSSLPGMVSSAAGYAGTASNFGTMASRLSTAAHAASGSLSRLGQLSKKVAVRAFVFAVGADLVDAFQDNMSAGEFAARTVAGASGFVIPAVGVVATGAVNSAFRGNPTGSRETHTQNTHALADHFSFIDSLEQGRR